MQVQEGECLGIRLGGQSVSVHIKQVFNCTLIGNDYLRTCLLLFDQSRKEKDRFTLKEHAKLFDPGWFKLPKGRPTDPTEERPVNNLILVKTRIALNTYCKNFTLIIRRAATKHISLSLDHAANPSNQSLKVDRSCWP